MRAGLGVYQVSPIVSKGQRITFVKVRGIRRSISSLQANATISSKMTATRRAGRDSCMYFRTN